MNAVFEGSVLQQKRMLFGGKYGKDDCVLGQYLVERSYCRISKM